MSNFAEKIMKTLDFFRFFLVILLLPLAFCACGSDKTAETELQSPPTGDTLQAPIRQDAQRDIVMSVRQQSRLYTTEFQVHKIVLYSDKSKIGGKLVDITIPGTRKIAIPIDVTLKAYVDLNAFSTQNVSIMDSICIITLPDPKIEATASRVDHSKTRQYISMARSKFSEEEISRLTAQGEDSILSHISQYGIVEQSREDFTRILVPILTRMGFDAHNVYVRFRKDFDEGDIRHFTTFQRFR